MPETDDDIMAREERDLGNVQRHVLEFNVNGKDATEIETVAKEVCDKYFGDIPYKMELEAHPVVETWDTTNVRYGYIAPPMRAHVKAHYYNRRHYD